MTTISKLQFNSLLRASITAQEYSLVGDSITQFGNNSENTGSNFTYSRDNNGLITITKATATNFIDGSQNANLVNVSDPTYEVIGAGSYVSANSYQIQTNVTGTGSTTATSAQAGASLVLQGQFSYKGIWLNLQSLAKGSLTFKGNWGQGGDFANQMTDAIAKACASSSKYVQLMCGTNDVKGNVAQATVIQRVKDNINQIRSLGKIPVVCAIIPLGVTYTGYSAYNTIIIAVNSAIQSYCSGLGIMWCDTFTPLYDSANNCMYSYDTSDGIHPLGGAAYLMAQAVWSVLSPNITITELLPIASTPSVPAQSPASYATIIRDRGPWSTSGLTGTFFAGGSAGTASTGVFPGLPAGWIGGRIQGTTATATFTVNDPGDGKGYYATMLGTAGAVNDKLYMYADGNATMTPATLGLQVGDRVILAAEVAWDNWNNSGCTNVVLSLQTNASGLYGYVYANVGEPAASMQGNSGTKILMTGAMTISASVTTLTPIIQAQFASISGSALSLGVRRLAYFKVSGMT